MPYAKKSDSKKKKKEVMKDRMEAFKEGDMHSGSESGPVVKNRKQAIAIALSMSGQSKKKKKHDVMVREVGREHGEKLNVVNEFKKARKKSKK